MSERDARELSFAAAALLAQGRKVDRLSCGITAAAIAVIAIVPAVAPQPPWTSIAFAVAAVLAGLAETYLAIRVGFDAELFRRLALTEDFASMDAALEQLGLLPAAKRGRPIEVRVAGAMRLLRRQVLALAAQVLCVLAGALMALTAG